MFYKGLFGSESDVCSIFNSYVIQRRRQRGDVRMVSL
jgi:hypothetical protein